MELPKAFLERISKEWTKEELSAYLAFFSAENHSIRINPNKNQGVLKIADLTPVPWCKETGFYLNERGAYTWDPAFQAGYYYVQEAASMAIGSVFNEWRVAYHKTGIVGIDSCAAPGGKSTHLLSLLDEKSDVLVSNEPIPKRRKTLIENIAKWGFCNSVVTGIDFTQKTLGTEIFDFAVVDAPCSGEGMFRKDDTAIEEWSEDNVEKCAIRQQEILSNLAKSIKQGGLLIYSTCTFNQLENEEICEFLLNADFKAMEINAKHQENGVKQIGNNGLRFIPGLTKSEGLFISAFIKVKAEDAGKGKTADKPLHKEISLPELALEKHCLIHKKDEEFYIITKEASVFCQNLRKENIHPGIVIGEEKGGKFMPHSPLAYASSLKVNYPTLQLEFDDAQAFLEGQALSLNRKTTGIHLCIYGDIPLGFVKAVGMRANNLREKHLRIKNSLRPENRHKLLSQS